MITYADIIRTSVARTPFRPSKTLPSHPTCPIDLPSSPQPAHPSFENAHIAVVRNVTASTTARVMNHVCYLHLLISPMPSPAFRDSRIPHIPPSFILALNLTPGTPPPPRVRDPSLHNEY